MINKIIQGDCLEVMKSIPDKSIDLVLTDPPYGLGYDKQAHKQSGTKYGNAAAKKTNYISTNWDNKTPNKEFFDELIRISKNQIIFGGEHLCDKLPLSRGWVVWNKNTGANNFSDCELIWTSFNKPIKKIDWTWNGMIQQEMGSKKEKRYHPTMKPQGVLLKLIEMYSKQGDVILDAFAGSGSTGVACKNLNRKYILIEKEPEYIEIIKDRLKLI